MMVRLSDGRKNKVGEETTAVYPLSGELKSILSFIEDRPNVVDTDYGRAEFLEVGVSVFGK